MGNKKKKKSSYVEDTIKALHIASRESQFERNGGKQWVVVNRPHKNKKKYDRKNFKRGILDDASLLFCFRYLLK